MKNDGKTAECPHCKRVVDVIAREYMRHRTPAGDVCALTEDEVRRARVDAEVAAQGHVARMLGSLAETIGS